MRPRARCSQSASLCQGVQRVGSRFASFSQDTRCALPRSQVSSRAQVGCAGNCNSSHVRLLGAQRARPRVAVAGYDVRSADAKRGLALAAKGLEVGATGRARNLVLESAAVGRNALRESVVRLGTHCPTTAHHRVRGQWWKVKVREFRRR